MSARQPRTRRDVDGRVPSHAPDWTDTNEHDPGLTVLALFAFLGTGLLWYSSGRREGAATNLPGLLGVGLGAAGAARLLLPRPGVNCRARGGGPAARCREGWRDA